MDNSPTLQKSVGQPFETDTKQKQRNKLVKSSISLQEDVEEEAAAASEVDDHIVRTPYVVGQEDNESGAVMGGGFATPPPTALQTATAITKATINTTTTTTTKTPVTVTTNPPAIPQMHEKLLDKDTGVKEKTEKLKPLKKDTEKPAKQQKDTKFAEKLRRSFRRGEHKSLEIKRPERVELLPGLAYSPQDNKNFGLNAAFQLHSKHSASIFSLSNLPGLGGHLNPALLLDSPDEATPPEFAYHHLSSVATTNSSTSLESNFDFGERTSSQSSISYWAWQQSNSSMGGEVSTTSSSLGGAASGGRGTAVNAPGEVKVVKESKKPETQISSRNDTNQQQQQQGAASTAAGHATASRCSSITSESSSAKLTRLQNFLFKSSNESSKSFQGHSNEAFTASSHNSSSGEWENLGAFASSSSGGGGGAGGGNPTHDFQAGSFPEESTNEAGFTALTESSEAGNYYQYTLTSPNNPFLPEIIARTYHSNYDEEPSVLQPQDYDLDANITSVKYGGSGIGGTRSAQLPTPAYSRAGSQESTHSEGGGARNTHAPTPSPASSSSSTPGRQKRKLFSLNSPTRLLQHQHQHHNQQQQVQQQQQSQQQFSSLPDASKNTSASGSLVRSLNPFLPVSTQNSGKRTPSKQAAVTSPIAVPQDLNSRREEFLRATMKICLFVSPPTSKLQLKSKSLTHLDGLDSMVACHHGAAAGKPSTSEKSALPKTVTASPLLPQPTPTVPQPPKQQQQHQPLTHAVHPTHQHRIAQRPPTIYTQAHHHTAQQSLTNTQSTAVSPVITTSASCHNTRICCTTNKASVVRAASVSSHQHPFQSDPTTVTTVAASTQNTLSPALAVISGNVSVTPTSSGSSTNIFHYGTSMSVPAPTPQSHKKKSTFMQRKKPLLTRSEVSSSEYFSVSFCTEQGCQDEEFIPATKGVTLLTALSQVLRRRNLSFSQITISDNNPPPSFLEAVPSPLVSSLDENTEVENLAGHHLIITEGDGSRKTLQKAASFGSRTRPPRLLSSASTEETSESGIAGKQLKQRWSGLFGIKNPQQSQLCELLNGYAKNGVPQKTAALNFDHPDFDAAQEYLDNMHKSWRDFVECESMSDSDTRIQTAIWELVTTEVYYIHALQTVTDLFLACLEAVQEDRLLTDVDQHRLFSNVRDICEANLKFWTLYLYPMVAHSVTTREPLRIGFFQQGFVAFASIFAPYKKYCAEQSTCQFYCKELNRNNALFTSYLAWCESQKMCNRLRLADILVRPMQRLTKYSLLLAAIKKHMSDVEEIETVDNMIHTVENFVCSVNNHLTTRQENERLKGVMARIESYDVVDTNNEQLDKMIKQYSQMFDLCAPMKGCPAHQVRHLFMEGDHKFKDNLGKADVHCFLLTDMLLVCKTIAKKGLGALKVIRQPYLTDRLMVQQTNNILNCVYLNEFQVAVTAFTLQCTEAKNWYESLKRAKVIYTRLKQGSNHWDSFRFGGSGASGGTADSLGVKKSPMNSSICSHVSSANNSHSGSVEWNDSRNISVDFEKTNSLSSDEGSSLMGVHGFPLKVKNLTANPHKQKIIATSANTLSVQPVNLLGQSLPNLNLHHSHTNLYHTYSNNTLLVPGTTTSHSGNLLLSPSHRGISYPPPSPTSRVPLRRGMAFSTSTKNPPLVKSRNITSQNSINWHQIPSMPAPLNLQALHNLTNNSGATAMKAPVPALVPWSGAGGGGGDGGISPTVTKTPLPLPSTNNNDNGSSEQLSTMPLSNHNLTGSNCQLQLCNETDV